MNIIKVWWLRWKYRKDNKDELLCLLDLSIKAGRRVTHDLNHAINWIPTENIHRKRIADRQNMWHNIFYPTNGMKDYRSQMMVEIMSLELEISRLQQLCKANGIDYEDPNQIPF